MRVVVRVGTAYIHTHACTYSSEELEKIMKEAKTFMQVVEKADDSMITKAEFKKWSYENIVRYLSSTFILECAAFSVAMF